MALEEYGRYTTEQWQVIMRWYIKDIVFRYGNQIADILQIPTKVWTAGYEDFEKFAERINQEHVIDGITSNLQMPTWQWHAESGICLWGNASLGWDVSREFREQYFKRRNINLP